MAILLTGGTGFIGAYLTRKLLNETEEKIVLYDYEPNIRKIDDVKDKATVIKGDILDFENLKDALKAFNITRIVHLASIPPPVSEEQPLKGIKVNCEGTANVFEAGRACKVDRIIYVSSASVNGPQSYYGDKVLDEDVKHDPILCYGAGKAFNENLATVYNLKYRVDVVGIKPIIVYGYGRARSGGLSAPAVTDVIEKPALGEPVTVPFGDWKLNIVYVKDVVNAFFLALYKENLKHRLFQIAGDVTTPREIAEKVRKIIPTASIKVEPGTLDVFHPLFDTSRARVELGWSPSYSLEEGVKDYINMIKKDRAKIQPSH